MLPRACQTVRGSLLILFILLAVVCGASGQKQPEHGAIQATLQSTGETHLYTGEQIDPDLGMYYLRARYYQPGIGRFWNMDSFEGRQEEPLSLHKYLYCHGNPVNVVDPSGYDGEAAGQLGTASIGSSLGSFHAQAMINAYRVQVLGMRVAGQVAPYLLAGTAALHVLDAGIGALLRNTEPVPIPPSARGFFIENKFGANLGSTFPKIDHWVPNQGLATSVRSHCLSGGVESYIESIERDARNIQDLRTGGSLVGYWRQGNSLGQAGSLTINPREIRAIALVEAIPETEQSLLGNPQFRSALQRIQETTRVIIRVVPTRGFRR
jgi:RHS repeat-associated protein